VIQYIYQRKRKREKEKEILIKIKNIVNVAETLQSTDSMSTYSDKNHVDFIFIRHDVDFHILRIITCQIIYLIVVSFVSQHTNL